MFFFVFATEENTKKTHGEEKVKVCSVKIFFFFLELRHVQTQTIKIKTEGEGYTKALNKMLHLSITKIRKLQLR